MGRHSGVPCARHFRRQLGGTDEQSMGGATIARNRVLRNGGIPITWGFLVCSVLVYREEHRTTSKARKVLRPCSKVSRPSCPKRDDSRFSDDSGIWKIGDSLFRTVMPERRRGTCSGWKSRWEFSERRRIAGAGQQQVFRLRERTRKRVRRSR
jgi:hypothetical protein